jgi:hypothetical protein
MLVFVQVIRHRGLPFNPTQTDIINPHSPARSAHTQNAPRFIKHQRRTHTQRFAQAQFCCPYRSPFMHSLSRCFPGVNKTSANEKKARASPVAEKM